MDVDALITDLSRDEGVRLKPYDDADGKPVEPGKTIKGKLTLGIGLNLTDVGITSEEAAYLCRSFIEREVVPMLNHYFPWWTSLDEDRQGVLANMAYNLGPRLGHENEHRGLLEFQWTMSLIQRGRYQDAAHAMLQSKWASQVGPRATRLAARMRGVDGPAG